MTVSPPPPPTALQIPTPSPRRPWQFRLRTLLLLLVAVAILASFSSVMPGLVLAAIRTIGIAVLAGVCAGGIFHDCDRARVAASGALLGMIFTAYFGGSSLSSVATDIVAPFRYGPFAGPLAVVLSLFSLLDFAVVAAMAAWIALLAAPRWDRWAISGDRV